MYADLKYYSSKVSQVLTRVWHLKVFTMQYNIDISFMIQYPYGMLA